MWPILIFWPKFVFYNVRVNKECGKSLRKTHKMQPKNVQALFECWKCLVGIFLTETISTHKLYNLMIISSIDA